MSGTKRPQYNSNKNKYWNHAKKKKYLEVGSSGFICTCNGKFKEKECVRDSYNLLNEFADEIFGKEEWRQKPDDNEDVDALLEDEIAVLKAQNESAKSDRRFQVVESGANGVIFIKTTVPDPCRLAYAIVSKVAETKIQKSKVVLRLTPVEITCKANMDDICKAAESILPKHFQEGGKKFSIIFSHKNNDSLSRDKIIEEMANKVVGLNETNTVDLKTPDVVVAVDVIRGICCLAVIPEYFALKKYNILELSQTETKKEELNEDCTNLPEVEPQQDSCDEKQAETSPKDGERVGLVQEGN